MCLLTLSISFTASSSFIFIRLGCDILFHLLIFSFSSFFLLAHAWKRTYTPATQITKQTHARTHQNLYKTMVFFYHVQHSGKRRALEREKESINSEERKTTTQEKKTKPTTITTTLVIFFFGCCCFFFGWCWCSSSPIYLDLYAISFLRNFRLVLLITP